MTKTPGFKIRIDAFLPIDKKDFAKQAKAYQMIADLQKPGAGLPADFLSSVTITGIDAKQGTAELPAADPNEPVLPAVADADAKNK